MKEFGPTARKTALTVHVICCGTWLGAATAMMVLIVSRGLASSSDTAFASTWLAIKTIDDFVIIAAAGASFVSGCVLSWGTKWGFLKWYWIAVKLVATTAMVAFGAFCLGPWINLATEIAVEEGVSATMTDRFWRTYLLVATFGTIQVFALLIVFGISIFKPWGKIPVRQKNATS